MCLYWWNNELHCATKGTLLHTWWRTRLTLNLPVDTSVIRRCALRVYGSFGVIELVEGKEKTFCYGICVYVCVYPRGVTFGVCPLVSSDELWQQVLMLPPFKVSLTPLKKWGDEAALHMFGFCGLNTGVRLGGIQSLTHQMDFLIVYFCTLFPPASLFFLCSVWHPSSTGSHQEWNYSI